jgi:membrane protein involved in colicin uptake
MTSKGEGGSSMTAEIVDLGKYREKKSRFRTQTPPATPETENETPPGEPIQARLEERRDKDSGEPV